MLNRKNFLFILTGTFIVTLLIVFLFIIGIMGKKEGDLAEEETVESIDEMFERELFSDTKLQEQAGDFALPANLLKLFHEHEEQLNAFAKQCYYNRVKCDSFSVRYIDGKRTYSCSSLINPEKNIQKDTEIQKEEYDYITSFMDYAIANGIPFRDWMLDIFINDSEYEGKRDDSYDLKLSITIYKTYGMEILFRYSSCREKDDSGEEFIDGGDCNSPGSWKSVRINENWYYKYYTIDDTGIWHPDYEDMAFAESLRDRKTTTVTKNFIRGSLQGFLRLYWKYGTDFTKIRWIDWDEFRWTEPYESELIYEIPMGDVEQR